MKQQNQAGLSSVESLLAMSLMLVIAGGLLTALVASNTRTQFLATDSASYNHASTLFERLMAVQFGTIAAPAPPPTELANLVSPENNATATVGSVTQEYLGSHLSLRQVAQASPLVWEYRTSTTTLPGADIASDPLAGRWEIRVSNDLNGMGHVGNPLNALSVAQGDLLRIEVIRNGRTMRAGIRTRSPVE